MATITGGFNVALVGLTAPTATTTYNPKLAVTTALIPLMSIPATPPVYSQYIG